VRARCVCPTSVGLPGILKISFFSHTGQDQAARFAFFHTHSVAMRLPSTSFTAPSFIHTHAPSTAGQRRNPCSNPFTCASTLHDCHRHQPSCVVLKAPYRYRLPKAPRGAQLQLQPGYMYIYIYIPRSTARVLQREHHSCSCLRRGCRRLVQVGDMILHRFQNFLDGGLPVWDHQRQEVATESGEQEKAVRNGGFVRGKNRCEPRHSIPVPTFFAMASDNARQNPRLLISISAF
jgi:hypothetical protein